MLRATECAVLSRRTHGEFVQVRLRDNDSASVTKARNGCRLERATVILEDARATGRRGIERRDVVLHDDGYAGERTSVAARKTLLECGRLIAHDAFVAPENGVQSIGAGTGFVGARERRDVTHLIE